MSDDDLDKPLTEAEEFYESLGTGGKPLTVEQIRQFALERPISLDDVDYVVGLYPSLDICNADLSSSPNNSIKPNILTAERSLWQIHDRGDRLTGGPGRLSFGAYRVRQYDEEGNPIDDDSGDGGEWVKPNGTSVQQYHDTAVQMIELAAERWASVAILGGFRGMQRTAWMAASEMGVAINFEPNGEDLMIFETVKRNGGVKGRRSGGGTTAPKPSQGNR